MRNGHIFSVKRLIKIRYAVKVLNKDIPHSLRFLGKRFYFEARWVRIKDRFKICASVLQSRGACCGSIDAAETTMNAYRGEIGKMNAGASKRR